MGRKIPPALIQAVKLEYVTDPRRPSLRELAAKYGIGLRTLTRYSQTEQWATLRELHWQQMAQAGAQSMAAAGAQAASVYHNAHEEATRLVRQMLDGLGQALAQVLRGLLPEPDMSVEELRRVAAKWEALDGATLLRALPTLAHALVDVVKLLEVIEAKSSEAAWEPIEPIELTPEEEEIIDRIWDKVRAKQLERRRNAGLKGPGAEA